MTKASKASKTIQDNSKQPVRKFYKKWWFWLIITMVVAAMIAAAIVVAVYFRSGKVTDDDRRMMSKYYPDFTLSTDAVVRECQLTKLRAGEEFVQEYEGRGSSNPAKFHYESLAERCGHGADDGGDVALKPILYLYPTKDTNVNVSLQVPEWIGTSYPKYGASGWSVTSYPNGDLTDVLGKKYYALYWDETNAKPVDFSTGFYVEKDGAAKFLEEKLTQIGLNDRERNEFIMYWLPKLEHNDKNLVYFELTDELQSRNKLNILPNPDSLLRVRMHMKKADSSVSIAPQNIPLFDRQGFAAVEWGGVEQ